MDFGPFPPAAAPGPVAASAASPSSSGWMPQLQMQDHHIHHHDERTSTVQQRMAVDAAPVDIDVSMLGTTDDVAVPSSSSISPLAHPHSHPHGHTHAHQHQQTHHSMPISHPHSYYTLSPFQFAGLNYGLSPYSSLSPNSGVSSSSVNTQHWNVPISSYSSLNGATNSQPTPTPANSSVAASSSGTTGSSNSPMTQQQPPMQSPVLSQQSQQHSPVMMHQQPQPQHQFPSQQPVQMQVMQNSQIHHSHSHSHSPTPVPSSAQQHQHSHTSGYLPQQQQQQSQQQTQITIDPTLMLANYTSNSYPPSAFYSYPQTLSLNPSLLHTSSSLASANPLISSPPTSSSQSQLSNQPTQVQFQHSNVSSPSGTPSRATLSSVLNGLLSAKILTSPSQIVRTIATMGATEVELPMRLQVLSKVRDCAGNDFYQAWAQNTEAMDIIREWLKNAVMSKNTEWEETIMPLLHVIDRLPLTVESLRSSKIGKVIVKLKEVSTSSAVKDMASNLENRWRSLVNTVDKSSHENGAKKVDGLKVVEDSKVKKRKLEEAAANKGAPATKKLALGRPGGAASVKPIAIKKESGMPSSTVKSGSMMSSSTSSSSTTTTVRDSKSDSSFFSAPKPKPKLPSFKKAPPLKKEGTDPNVAQPSSVDPFKDALAAMTKARGSPTPSAAVAAANAAYAAQIQGMQGSTTNATGNNGDGMIVTSVDGTSAGTGMTTATGKKKKRVSFKAEKDLVQIKLIEPAVYDDDAMGANAVYHNVRDLDRDEGAAMHKHMFEEQIDWVEPLLLDLPAGPETPKGQHSQEKITQEEREKTALNALYMPSQIPDSPAEPATQTPEDEVDMNVKYMLSGNEVRELTLDRGHGAGGVGPGVGVGGIGNSDASSAMMSTLSVQGLISQLAAGLSAANGGATDGLGADSLSGLAALPGSGDSSVDSHGITTAVTAASMQPTVDLKQLGLDINLIAQLAAQHSNLSSSSSSSSSSINNGFGYGNGSNASHPSTGSTSSSGFPEQNHWNSGAPTSSLYGDYSSSGQYDDDNASGHRSRNWDPSADHSWRGGRGGGKGGRGTGLGRGGGGFKHTKRKLCTFFANGRCRYGDQCDFLHEL